jgi:hypothetical protein
MVVRPSGGGATEVTGGRWAIQEGKARREEEGSPKPNTSVSLTMRHASRFALNPRWVQ